jgi:transcriptional regulator with XRE-family HTH domain
MTLVADLPKSGTDWRALREERGLDVYDLAAATSLQVSTIRNLERGEHVRRSTRTLVAAALGIPVFGAPAKAVAA